MKSVEYMESYPDWKQLVDIDHIIIRLPVRLTQSCAEFKPVDQRGAKDGLQATSLPHLILLDLLTELHLPYALTVGGVPRL